MRLSSLQLSMQKVEITHEVHQKVRDHVDSMSALYHRGAQLLQTLGSFVKVPESVDSIHSMRILVQAEDVDVVKGMCAEWGGMVQPVRRWLHSAVIDRKSVVRERV